MKFPVKIIITPKINKDSKKYILCQSDYTLISFYLNDNSPISCIHQKLSCYFLNFNNKNTPFVINKITDNNDDELILYYDIIGIQYNSIDLDKVKKDDLIIVDYNVFFEKLIGVNNG